MTSRCEIIKSPQQSNSSAGREYSQEDTSIRSAYEERERKFYYFVLPPAGWTSADLHSLVEQVFFSWRCILQVIKRQGEYQSFLPPREAINRNYPSSKKKS